MEKRRESHTLLAAGGGGSIPADIVRIGAGAFAFHNGLKSISTIGKKAFVGCQNLKTVRVGKDTALAEHAFPEDAVVTVY